MERIRSSSLLSILFVLCTALTATAQWDITIVPQVIPPYSANYADYFTDASQVQITITSTAIVPKDIYLAGSLSTTDGSISVRVSGDTRWAAPPLQVLPLPTINQYTGIDLQPAIQGGGGLVIYDGITNEQIALGLLPEGEYILCLQAYDYATGEQLSNGDLGCSNPFRIQTAPPPTLLAPVCDEALSVLPGQAIPFSWILPIPQPMVQYNFRLVKIFDAIDAQNGLESSTDVVWQEILNVPLLMYDGTKPTLQEGQQYAWWVQATTLSNDVLFENQGYSPPCTFTYSSMGSIASARPFQLVYPHQQDTLPWSNLPVIAHFELHPVETGSFHSMLTRVRDGSETSVNYRQTATEYIQWNSGPYLSQKALLPQTERDGFTQDMSQHINVYKNDPTLTDEFKHGSRYDLSAELEVATYNRNEPVDGDVFGQFVSGMGKPVPLSPFQNAEFILPEGDAPEYPEVPLTFRTAEPPEALFPPYPIYIIQNGELSKTFGSMHEKWRLQVSRNEDMSDPVFTSNGSVGNGFNVNTGSIDKTGVCQDRPCVINAVYKEVTVDYTPNDTGWYYWRIGWLQDTTNVTGPTYHDCTVRRFQIKANSPDTVPEVTETVREPECLAESRRAPTPAAEKIPVSTTAVGDIVEVGLFNMTVTQITNSGGFASGQGTIDVPVMRASLLVEFSGVQINAQKRLYNGVVKGKYDNAGVVPLSFIEGSALAAGFDPDAAQQLDNYLNSGGRLISQFVGNSPKGLPIGMDTEVPGGRFTVGILATEFTDTIAHLNAGMALPLNDVGITFGLGNMSIPFQPDGIGDLSEEGTLYLLGDVKLSVGADSLYFKGATFAGGYSTVMDSGTFVAWDCKGFRALTIDAQYRFSKDNLREDLADGSDGPTKVVGSIKVRTGRGGFMGRINFNKPFHLANTKGWGFQVQEAWLDYASYANPPGLTEAVQQIGATNLPLGANAALPAWNGLLVKRTLLRMPEELERLDGTGRLTAQVDNLIYSYGQGLSAQIKVANILGPDQGTLSGWGFSMDTLQLDIISNVFSQGGFKGMIHVPCSDTLLAYSAMIQQDITTSDVRMEFLLHPDGQLNIPMIVGQLSLLETSTVQAIIGDATLGTYVKAELNGTLDITADLSEIGEVDFKLIKFEHLTFQTNDPYTNADGEGVFSLASPQKFMGGSALEDDPTDEEGPTKEGHAGGFPVSLTRVEMERRTEDGKPLAGISFDLNLKLTGETNAFRATTRFSILGELNTSSLHEWGHHSVELDSIGISGNTGAVRIQGSLVWYKDDPVYGDGIKGQLEAGFLNEKVQVRAAAQFGNVNDMSYWYVDAMGAWQNGISPGSAFNIYGFGGGAWYHMKRTSPPVYALELTVGEILNQDNEDYEPGFTPSGVKMVPDAATLFGFQATVVFGDGASGRAYNGDVSAGMSFTESGGVSTAFLSGDVFLMSERDDREYVPVWGHADISFDIPNDVFAANFTMYVDVAHGMMVGSGEGNLAGAANILISPDTWHFFVGTPSVPIGLKLAGFLEGQFYFMVGKDLPGAMAPPAGVQAIIPANYGLDRDFPSADGLAFGTRVSYGDTLQFLLFKLRLAAEIGFDMAFGDAGTMECVGIDPPGIQGWYANGQLYAYISAGLSLYVDIWIASGEYHLVDITAAAVLRGGFANPSWAKGGIFGTYSILDGWVSGSVDFPISLGDPCQPPSSGLLSDLNPIGDLVPHDQDGMYTGSIRVDCGVQPNAALNMTVNNTFSLVEMLSNGSRKTHFYRLLIDKFELKNKESGMVLPGDIALSSNNMDVTFGPNAYLVPNTEHTIMIRIRAEERMNDVWVQALKPGTSEAVVWEKINTFKTDAGLKELDADAIDYSYPFQGQRFLLQDECRNGLIQCRSNMVGQPFLDSPAGKRRTFKAMFTPKDGGATLTEEVTVSNGERKTWFYFTIPSVVNLITYRMMLVARDEVDLSNMSLEEGPSQPATGGGKFGTGPLSAQNTNYSMAVASEGSSSLFNNTVKIRMRALSGYTLKANETRIWDYYFRSSQYNTLEAKVAAMQNTGTTLNATTGFQTMSPSFQGEKFDVFDVNPFEINDSTYMNPMVTLGDPQTDYWYTHYAKPVLFDYYDAIKARQCANGTLLTLPNYLAWAPYVNPAPPLSTAETGYSPLMQTGYGDYGSKVEGESPSIPLPPVRLFMNAAYYAYWNYAQLQSITIELDANCSRLGGEQLGDMGDELRAMRDRFLNTPYQVLYKGQYGARFTFVAPTCLPDPENHPGGNVGVSQANTVYVNTTGPTQPIEHMNTSPGGTGAGGIQVGGSSPPPKPPTTRPTDTGNPIGDQRPGKP
ncbi:MAG: hypothetical protein IPN44_12710 [Flavobacteriales bacterium]|nr:hypothetical protein [Flavobacteriales bacterium]